jgi:hypothetical protein
MAVANDLIVGISAPLIVALLIWLTGLPRKGFTKVAAYISARRLAHVLRQGPFDSGTIGRAVQYYVRPMCSTSDPSIEAEPAQALITPRESLFKVLDRFLGQSVDRRKHLLLLADSGMGKTSFLLNYFAARGPKVLGGNRNIQLISLAQNDCDQLIDAIPIDHRRSVDLFLDALDEDQHAYGRVRERVAEIVKRCHRFRSVVITCRSQFFASDDEIPVETGLYKAAPVPANESKVYCFRRLYLSPFDDDQIDEYLKRRYPGVLNAKQRSEARRVVKKIPALSVRPMLLAHLPDIMRTDSAIHYPVDVYGAMVDAWLVRESSWVFPDKLRNFSERLAIDLYFNSGKRDGEAALPEEICALAIAWGIDLDPAHLTSRSLLNRTSDGRYKFAHRSIMEFFVANYLIYGDISQPVEITDQIAQFITQRLGCWDVDAGNLFAYSRVDLEHIEPESRLGYDTDCNLFAAAGDGVSVQRLMEVRVSEIGSRFSDLSLSSVIIQCSEVAAWNSASNPVEVVLRFAPSDWSEKMVCNCTMWHENAAVLVKLVLDRKSLFAALDVGDALHLMRNDFILHGRYTEGGLNSWEVRRRVVLPIFEANKAAITSSLSANPAVSFYQRSNDDAVIVRFFKAYLNRVGPLHSFGILSDIRGPNVEGGMMLLKPLGEI